MFMFARNEFFYVDSICLDRWIGDDGFFLSNENKCVEKICYILSIKKSLLYNWKEMTNLEISKIL